MPGYEIRHGDLYWRSGLVIPSYDHYLIKRILEEFHSSPIGVHVGFLSIA